MSVSRIFGRPGRRRLFVGGAGLFLAPAIVRAQPRARGVAMVMGNSKYRWEAPLPNVVRDTADVARQLETFGLRTELLQDVNRTTALAALEKFKRTARGEDLAVFYYAGHGASWDKDTYLVPADAELSTPEAVRALVPVTAVSEAVGGATNKVLAFDSCRNNPADGWRQRAASELARINAASLAEAAFHGPNTLILFSTAPGHVALDGPAGQNSPFAAAFVRQLAEQSVDLTSMPAKLRRDLLIATEGQQVIWDINTFTGPLTIGKLVSRQQSSAASRSDAAPPSVVDRGRIVELPHAYEFARQKNLPLPPGLVAVRSAFGSPHDSKCGAFQYPTPKTFLVFLRTRATGDHQHG